MALAYRGGVTDILPFPDMIKMKFERSTLRFFPLPADIAQLQAYCDQHLNFPKESARPPVHFKAAVPYVVLFLSDYPRMTQGGQWVQSREVLFGVPVEWYDQEKDGKLHFRDWGMTVPYIYLDSPIAVSIGREIYGLPKGMIETVEDPSQPANANKPHPYLIPSQPRRLLAYNLPEFHRRKPGNPQEFSRSFLELFQDYHGYPWTMTRPADLLSAWSRTTDTYFSAISTILRTTATIPRIWEAPKVVADLLAGAADQLRRAASKPIGQAAWSLKDTPIPDSQSLETFATMMQKGLGSAGVWFPQMISPLTDPRQLSDKDAPASPLMRNHINLKQFPDAADPTKACYQAIVRSSAKVLKVNDAGFLFDPISGDPSGGLSIRIHDVEPIVQTLGIYATREPGDHFATIKPVFPFWWNLDVGYGSAENLCWRTKNSFWSLSEEAPAGGAPAHPYLRIDGTVAKLEVRKPFASPSEVTIHILPLRADLDGLKKLSHSLLNKDLKEHQFHPAAPYILMLVAQYEEMKSGDGREWADTEVTFALPALDANDEPYILPLIGFANSEWNAISDREIYGRFTMQSSIEVCDQDKADNLSLDNKGPQLWFYVRLPLMADKDDIEIKKAYATILVSKLKADGGVVGAVNADLEKWLKEVGFLPEVPEDPGDCSFKSAALKQFRDAADPINLACFRELVTIERRFSGTTKKWITKDFGVNLQVTIREFENVELATKLCLTDGRSIASRDRRNVGPYPVRMELQNPDLLQLVLKSIKAQFEFDVQNPIWIRGKVVAA